MNKVEQTVIDKVETMFKYGFCRLNGADSHHFDTICKILFTL